MNAKQLAWALVTATAAATSSGIVLTELSLAIASVMLGALALAASLVARRQVGRFAEDRMKGLEIA